MYAYFPRFLPSDLHGGTQHQSFEGMRLSTMKDVLFTILRQTLLTKPEVVLPAVYVNPRDQ